MLTTVYCVCLLNFHTIVALRDINEICATCLLLVAQNTPSDVSVISKKHYVLMRNLLQFDSQLFVGRSDWTVMDLDKENLREESAERESSTEVPPSDQQTRKKSGSFISRLQPSKNNSSDPYNIPSSITNALSSISTFASNFNITSSQSSGNNINISGNSSDLTIETASTSTKLSQTIEGKEEILAKRAAQERQNLISLTKLIVKDLITSSLNANRTIEEGHDVIHLNNYFTLIDRVLKHGLKQNLLSNKSANLWNAIDGLPKYLKESTLMSESVRSLANTRTPDGKIKAWMRLAMMQKKLPEYFNELLTNRDVLLKDIYHDCAFMLNDEGQVFAGLIIGVNVIDCNFFVKDANFDQMDDIIDLRLYLRAANSCDETEVRDDNSTMLADGTKNMKAVLDQKNYLEEWNKRLENTVFDLQAKIKNLEEQNSKLEMETKLSEARILKLQGGQQRSETPLDCGKSTKVALPDAITGAIKNIISSDSHQVNNLAQSQSATVKAAETLSSTISETEEQQTSGESGGAAAAANRSGNSSPAGQDESSGSAQRRHDDNYEQAQSVIEQLKKALASAERESQEQVKELSSLRERTSILEGSYRGSLDKIRVLERDLDVQTSMNSDKDTTIKIYEKDIREKQAQAESLRNSLNDARKINSDLSEKLNETGAKLKDHTRTIASLQNSVTKWRLENKNLATRYEDKQVALKSINSDLDKALETINELKKSNEKLSEELRRERESGQSCSVTVDAQSSQISGLQARVAKLEIELKDTRPFKEQTDELQRRCREYEQSLEEIGAQLRESRLDVENLKENSAVFLDSQWMDSKQVKCCAACEQQFSVTRRKHHCRLCGNVFCQPCSDNKMELASSAKPVRVCDTCHAFLLAKFVKATPSSSGDINSH